MNRRQRLRGTDPQSISWLERCPFLSCKLRGRGVNVGSSLRSDNSPVTSQLQYLLCLVVVASPQAALAQFTPATTAPAPVAHVYVQTPKGVNLYSTSSTGKLTLAAGSPFKTVG